MNYLQGRAVHVDRHLSNVALNYTQEGKFIAPQIFPVVNVQKQTDMIKTYTQADLFRQYKTSRSPGAEANKIAYQVGSDSYVCKNFAAKMEVALEDRINADPAFLMDLEEGRVRFLANALNLDWERRIANQVTATTNVGTSSNVASSWTDHTNANPFGNIMTQIYNLEDATGYKPNRVVFSNIAWRHFSRNAAVIDKIQKTGVTGGGLQPTVEQAAQLLQVDKVLVGQAYLNTAEEGIAQSLTPVWGYNVLVYYAPPSPSIEIPSFGYTLRWTANGLPNMSVERHPYDALRKCDEIEMGYYQAEKILATPLGALITNVTCSQ